LRLAGAVGKVRPALNRVDSPSSRPRLLAALAISIAIALLFVWEVRSAPPATIDDAYITFSFSKNVALGHGPVYGHGEVVEGYSNFLWMLVVALGLLIRPGADPAGLAHWLALPFLALLALGTYRLCRPRVRAVWAAAAAALAVVNGDSITSFQIGLETLPYTALLTCSFWLYVESFSRPRLGAWVVPAFVTVGLMRIDGCLPLGFILGYEAVRRFRGRTPTAAAVRAYAAWALPGLVAYLLWFAWRWHDYGLPLPATYYAKALLPKVLPDRGWQYVREEMLASGLFLALPFGIILLVRRNVAASALVLYAMGHVLYVIKVGGDWMPYGRFLLPIFPLTLVLACWGGHELGELATGRAQRLLRALGLGGALVFLAVVALRTEPHLLGTDLQRKKRAIAEEQYAHVQRLKAAAALLELVVPPGGRLVTDYGGVLAYYTDAAPIEMWGLCNATIATRGGLEGVNPIYGRTCPACYPELDPDFFHVMVPLVRPLDAFQSHEDVVRGVWQTDTIGRYLDFRTEFVAGRVMIPAQNQALYFLERRRASSSFRPRSVGPGVVIDYPFEPGGRAPGV
jgi:hypothetical protein